MEVPADAVENRGEAARGFTQQDSTASNQALGLATAANGLLPGLQFLAYLPRQLDIDAHIPDSLATCLVAKAQFCAPRARRQRLEREGRRPPNHR